MVKVLKNKKAVAVVAAVVVIIAIAAVSFIINRNRVNLSKYISVDYTGANGFASANIKADNDKIYETVSKGETSGEKLSKYRAFADSVKPHTDASDISNGESYTVEVQYDTQLADELGLNIVNDNYKIKAKGITDGQQIDLFENISVTFTGVSPDAAIDIKNNWEDDFLKNLEIVPDKTDSISKNDEITISCKTSEDDFKRHGYIVSELSVKVKADKLSVYTNEATDIPADTLSETDKVCSQTIIDQTKDQTFRMLYRATGNKEYLHKKNDETAENIQLVNKYFLKRKEKQDKITDNYIYLVYKATVKSSDAESEVYFIFEFSDSYVNADNRFAMEISDTDKRYTCSDNFELLYQNLINSKTEQYNVYEIAR